MNVKPLLCFPLEAPRSPPGDGEAVPSMQSNVSTKWVSEPKVISVAARVAHNHGAQREEAATCHMQTPLDFLPACRIYNVIIKCKYLPIKLLQITECLFVAESDHTGLTIYNGLGLGGTCCCFFLQSCECYSNVQQPHASLQYAGTKKRK